MKKRKTNQLKLWAIGILVIVLFAAPSGWAQYLDCDSDGSPYYFYVGDIDDVYGLNIYPDTIVNLYTSVPDVFVAPGGILNIYSGSIGMLTINNPGDNDPDAIVTVYGTNFKVDWQCDGTIVSLDGATEFTPLLPTTTYMGGSILIATDEKGNSMDMLCFSNTPIHLVDLDLEEETIEIDIKPGCDENVINLKSKGVVPVALLSEGDFKAGNIDPGSVKFAGAKPVRSTLCDVDCDGDMDMLFHFRTQKLNLDENSTEGTLTATIGGEQITATDSVRIVPCKKKNYHSSDKKKKNYNSSNSKKKNNNYLAWDKKYKFSNRHTPKQKLSVREYKWPGRNYKDR